MSMDQRAIQAKDSLVVAIPQGAYVYTSLIRLLTIAMAFINNIDLARVDRGAESGMTVQSLVKVGLLLVSGAVGIWGWERSPAVRRLFLSLPGLLLLALGIWYFATIPTSIVKKISLAAGVTYFCILFFTVSAVTFVGGRRMMIDICIGLLLYVVASVGLYFIWPEQAFFTEVLSETTQKIRFSGLGHPNVLGRICIFCSLLLLAGAMHRSMSWLWFWITLPFLLAICWASLSRTPVIAGLLAVALVALPSLKRPEVMYGLAVLLVVAVIGMVATESLVDTDRFFEKIIAGSTKTGSVEEVTTMTGRTVIWRYAWEKALESPLFGYGAGSTPVLMASVSSHAHNILLQPTVSIGFPGGILFALILAWNIYCAIHFDLPMLRMSTVFICTLGIAETPLFNPLPESVTLMWLVCCFWPLSQDADRTPMTYYRQSPFRSIPMRG